MESFNSISLREEKRVVLMKDGSPLSDEAEAYLKENHIPYNILLMETKYSFDYIDENYDKDDEEDEEWYTDCTDCIIEQNTEEGFDIILWHNLQNNKN